MRGEDTNVACPICFWNAQFKMLQPFMILCSCCFPSLFQITMRCNEFWFCLGGAGESNQLSTGENVILRGGNCARVHACCGCVLKHVRQPCLFQLSLLGMSKNVFVGALQETTEQSACSMSLHSVLSFTSAAI